MRVSLPVTVAMTVVFSRSRLFSSVELFVVVASAEAVLALALGFSGGFIVVASLPISECLVWCRASIESFHAARTVVTAQRTQYSPMDYMRLDVQ